MNKESGTSPQEGGVDELSTAFNRLSTAISREDGLIDSSERTTNLRPFIPVSERVMARDEFTDRLSQLNAGHKQKSWGKEEIKRGYNSLGFDVKRIIRLYCSGANYVTDGERVEAIIAEMIVTGELKAKRAKYLPLLDINKLTPDHIPDQCPICLKTDFLLFTAPCHPEHKFHIWCLNGLYRKNKENFNCPLCRKTFLSQMDEKAESQSTVGEPEVFTEPCSNCDVNCGDYQFNCEICCDFLCQDCVVKNHSPNGEVQLFCATCLATHNLLRKIHHKKIDDIKSKASMNCCDICDKVTCDRCEIDNDDQTFCFSCVDHFGTIGKSCADVVDENLRKKTD